MLEVTKKLNVPTHKQCTQVKVALLGDEQCGKSALVAKYTENTFSNSYTSTLGVDSGDKYIDSKAGQVHMTLWDFSGKLDFLEIRNQFYREIQCAIICADLSSKSSCDTVDYWFREVKESGANPFIILVGTKCDIKKNHDMAKIAKDRGCQYFQVSSKTGDGIDDLMYRVVAESRA